MLKLTESRRHFHDRWGRSAPTDLPDRARGENSFLEGNIKRMSRAAPSWSRSVINNVYVGISSPSPECNIEVNSHGSAFISVFPLFGALTEISIGMSSAYSHTPIEHLSAVQRGAANDDQDLWPDARTGWRNLARWTLLPRRLLAASNGDPQSVLRDFEALHSSLPQQLKTNERDISHHMWCLLLGHEYSHILLGHLGKIQDGLTEKAQQQVLELDQSIVNEELACDALGTYLGLLLPMRTPPVSPAQHLARLSFAYEAVTAMAITLICSSDNAVYASVFDDRGHPDPFARCETMADLIAHEIDRVIEVNALQPASYATGDVLHGRFARLGHTEHLASSLPELIRKTRVDMSAFYDQYPAGTF